MLFIDLTRKVLFKCQKIDENIPDSDDNTADYVDSDEFWNKVNINLIMRGFTATITVELEVKPSICNWLPYLGKFKRSSNILVNKATWELEVDCKELSEERLLEFMHKGKLIEIKKSS